MHGPSATELTLDAGAVDSPAVVSLVAVVQPATAKAASAAARTSFGRIGMSAIIVPVNTVTPVSRW